MVASPQATLFVLPAPAYPVDGDKPLADMLFFDMIAKASKKDW